MSSGTKLNAAAAAVRGAFDRRTIAGIIIGSAIMLSAVATAQTSGSNSGWFNGLFSSGGTSSSGVGTALISQQESVVAASINAEAADCAEGKPGTIGEAMQAAVKVHSQIASATPAVESLFDAAGSCFNGQLFDLSFAIPSLASMLAAVESAVLKYAQKKVCTAVNRVTSMVTSPINQSIAAINQMGDVNGILNGKIGGAMSQIDPALGAEYHPPVADSTYVIGTNPFNKGQTTFDTSSGGSTSGQVSNTVNGYNSQITALTQQVASQQIKIQQSTLAVEDAKRDYNNCGGGNGFDCTRQFDNLLSTQQNLANAQATLIAQQQQLSQVVPATAAAASTVTAAPQPAVASAAPAAAAKSSQESAGWWSNVSGIFN